jgi:hypothetical protein
LYRFSIGSMRPFGDVALEILSMAEPMVRGTVTGTWDQSFTRDARPAKEIDNEIHYRGQGFVYLRALSIEPPPFYERA